MCETLALCLLQRCVANIVLNTMEDDEFFSYINMPYRLTVYKPHRRTYLHD